MDKVERLNLIISAGQARPTPPIGPQIAQKGLPIAEVCKSINDITSDYPVGALINVIVKCKPNRKYEILNQGFNLRYLIEQEIGINKFKGKKTDAKITITSSQLDNIVKLKFDSRLYRSVDSLKKMIISTMSSMRIVVLD